MKKLGFILVLMILSLQGWAQVAFPYFNKVDDFAGLGMPDMGYDILSTSDSTYAVCAMTGDTTIIDSVGYIYFQPSIILIDEEGQFLQKKGFPRRYEQLGNSHNQLFLPTPDGGFAIAGVWQRYIPGWGGSYYGRFLLKLTATLDSSWMVLDSGTLVMNDWVGVSEMVIGSDKSYFLLGSNPQYHPTLTKFDSLGNFRWTKLLPLNAFIWSMQTLQNGNLMLAGKRNYNPEIYEYDLDGNLVWDTTFNNVGNSYANVVYAKQLTDGSFFLMDYVPNMVTNDDLHCMWWTSSKQLHQSVLLPIMYDQTPYSVIEMADGSIVIAGQTGADGNVMIDARAFLLKLSPTGNLDWLRFYYYRASGGNDLESCIRTHDGGFLMTGGTSDSLAIVPSMFTDVWILKVDSVGCPFPNCGPSLFVEPNSTESTQLVKASPNPASSHLQLKAIPQDFHEQAVIHLRALDGRVMEELILPMGFKELTFDVSRYPAGMYLWEYKDAAGRREAARFEVMRN